MYSLRRIKSITASRLIQFKYLPTNESLSKFFKSHTTLSCEFTESQNTIVSQCYFQLSPGGGGEFPPPRIPNSPPEKHPKYKKTLKNVSNLPPRYVFPPPPPRTWSLELTLIVSAYLEVQVGDAHVMQVVHPLEDLQFETSRCIIIFFV